MSKVRVGNRIIECANRYTGYCKEGKPSEKLREFVKSSSQRANTSANAIKKEQQTR